MTIETIRKVFFISKGNQSFVKKDIKFLTHNYNLIDLKYDRASSFTKLMSVAKQLFLILRLLKNRGNNIIIIWFADYHGLVPTFIAQLSKTPILLMLGGYDTVGIKELKYGVFNNKLRGIIAKYIIKNASVLLPVTQKLVENLEQFRVQINGRIIELPTSYESNFWVRSTKKIPKTVVTVAHFDSRHRLLVKGVDRFIKWANHSPDLSFRLIGVGRTNRYLQEYNIPNNLEILGFLSQDSIKDHYSECYVYAQLSRSEGLPNAVCEALLCECYIIGTEVGELGNLIRNGGGKIYDGSVTYDTLSKYVSGLKSSNTKGREFVKNKYSQSLREKELKTIISGLPTN